MRNISKILVRPKSCPLACWSPPLFLGVNGKVDEPGAETHGMFHEEQQRSNRSKKIVAD
jgi:hypothetical protein